MPVPQQRVTETEVKSMTEEQWLQKFCEMWQIERHLVMGIVIIRDQSFALTELRDVDGNKLFYPIQDRDSTRALNESGFYIGNPGQGLFKAKAELEQRGFSLGDLIIGELIASKPNVAVKSHLNSFWIKASSLTKAKRIQLDDGCKEIICDGEGNIVSGVDFNETIKLNLGEIDSRLESEIKARQAENDAAKDKLDAREKTIRDDEAKADEQKNELKELLENLWSLAVEADESLRATQTLQKEIDDRIWDERQILLGHLVALLEIRRAKLSVQDEYRKVQALLERAEQDPNKVLKDQQNAKFSLNDGESWQRLVDDVQAWIYTRRKIYFPQYLIADFLTLIRTSDFFILSGEPGCGKSQMVRCFADAVGGSVTTIAVQPNWTSKDDLLGYFNPVQNSFVSTEFLKALIEAREHPEKLHLICLDEMNLARVENYFAYFLSHLEDRSRWSKVEVIPATELEVLREKITRHDAHQLGTDKGDEGGRDRTNWKYVEPFPFPKNVRIIGTVNFDETTQHFSPKLFDRTHVVRFPDPLEEPHKMDEQRKKDIKSKNVDNFYVPYAELACTEGDYPEIEEAEPFMREFLAVSNKHLKTLGAALSARSYRQAISYTKLLTELGPPYDEQAAINQIVLHKIFPRMSFEWDYENVNRDGTEASHPRKDAINALSKYLKKLKLSSEFTGPTALDVLEKLVNTAQEVKFFNGMG
jgi:hypothetical protein